jgi:hypothetical protein
MCQGHQHRGRWNHACHEGRVLALSNQRTCCERINSQAKALGIENPKVRNIHSVRNLNTLTYLIVNVRALKRAKSINKGLLPMN